MAIKVTAGAVVKLKAVGSHPMVVDRISRHRIARCFWATNDAEILSIDIHVAALEVVPPRPQLAHDASKAATK